MKLFTALSMVALTGAAFALGVAVARKQSTAPTYVVPVQRPATHAVPRPAARAPKRAPTIDELNEEIVEGMRARAAGREALAQRLATARASREREISVHANA